jgi:hypothetical protein
MEMEFEFLNQRDYFDYYNQDLLDFITNYIIPYNSQFERRSEYLYYKRILEMLFQEDFLKEDIYYTMGVYLSMVKDDIEEDMNIIRQLFNEVNAMRYIYDNVIIIIQNPAENLDNLENVKNIVIKEELDKIQIVSFSELKTDEKECSICLDEFEPSSKIRIINCKHVFHSECLDTWLLQHDYKCPHCREKVAEYKSDLKS